ncbi:MAG TPA: ATP-binding protein [Gaiellaceae bacterium]|nr:ATP-binding protein [Gaiellaceae bacterium]
MTIDNNRRPTLAIVAGRPGSGKTTLARELANALSCPLISRDEINKGIFHSVEHDPDLAAKDRVAKLAFDAFFGVIELLVSCGVTLVAEAAFQDRRWRIGLDPIAPLAGMKVIHCTVDPELAHQRVFRRRLEQQGECQSTRACADASAANFHQPDVPTFEPLSLPVPSIHVATADGYDPPLDEILAFITSR